MSAASDSPQVDVLLVEDNPGDVRLTKEAFKSAEVDARLHCVRNGEAAVDFLWRRGEHGDAPRPHMVLLDLNLPKKSGSEVLKEIKTDMDLCKIPVIILTSSGNPDDIALSYSLHANCYVRKPMELSAFHDVVRKIDEFWLSIARLPEA